MLATELLSSHSELDPPLPIPNRAVKRLSADDSADYPCESRTLLGSLSAKKALFARAFLFSRLISSPSAKILPGLRPRQPTPSPDRDGGRHCSPVWFCFSALKVARQNLT